MAVCNFFGCNCDPCYGCGPGRDAGGTPSCDQCDGGCDQECESSNWDSSKGGACTRCGQLPGGKRSLLDSDSDSDSGSDGAGDGDGAVDTNTGCADLERTFALPLSELHEKLSMTFCEFSDHRVGFAFFGAFLNSMDVDGDGAIGCAEYQLAKLNWPLLRADGKKTPHQGSMKLPKAACKLSGAGKDAVRRYTEHLKAKFTFA